MSRKCLRRAALLAAVLFVAPSCSGDSETPTQPAPPVIDVEGLQTCLQVGEAMQMELAYIQRCGATPDCGQVLRGTSCGCSRDLVARLDADVRRFYQIVDKGQAMSCNQTAFITICDCPATDGFLCTVGRCGWNYVQ